MSNLSVLESRSFKFDEVPAARPASAAPSLDLTASDGTGLLLMSLSARVVIQDPLAFTELHLVFHNPEARQLEGRFRIALPSGASVSRFAMRIGMQWQEGEVVPRQAARRAYEDFLHRRQDPALLEHEAGNEFSARVFPIEANRSKEIIVSYSHELSSAGDPYRLPLVGLPEVQNLEIRALVGRAGSIEAASSSLGGTAASWKVVEVRKTGWRPDIDFELSLPPGRAGLRHGNLAVVRVLPDLPTQPDEIPSLHVLLDTSASRALGHERQVELVERLVRALVLGGGRQVPLAITCFDQGVEGVFAGAAGDFSAADSRAILARLPLGASDLAGALRWAAASGGVRYERMLLVTDGVATAGDTEAEKIAAAARSLSQAGVKRLDVLAVGGLRDDTSLRRLVTTGLERDGTVCDGDLSPPEIAARLTRATRSGIEVEVPGASWVWPSRLDGMQPGDAALIYADVPAQKDVSVLLDKVPVPFDLTLDTVERPLLERAWVKARMERLEDMRARADTDPDVRAGLQKQIADLSVKHRVLCPYTALLVLETEADYERFQIDRHALSDILTVGLSGIEVLQRTAGSAPAQPLAKVAPRPSREQTKAKRSELLSRAPADDHDEEVEEYGETRALEPEGFADVPLPEPLEVTAASLLVEAPAPAPAPASPSPMRQLRTMVTDEVSRVVERPSPPAAPPPPRPAQPPAAAPPAAAPPAPPAPEPSPEPSPLDAWTGTFRDVMELVLAGKPEQALALALSWRQRSPGDVLALVAIGEAAELTGDLALAARAYGSLIDLFPSRADLRRFAGERLSRLAPRSMLDLAIDTYRRAVESRPDHPSGHRLLGMALLRAGRPDEAFEALAAGQARSYPAKFPGIPRILSEDLGLVAAAWIRAEPSRRDDILGRLSRAGARLEDEPSVRFVLVWETDANDVDFHIHDARGGHAYFREKVLPSGGELYADVTQGYGPECFTIRGEPASRAYPYRLQAHYYRQGPMGYGMGALQIVEHDGRGGFAFDERPYVAMRDGAYVDLGAVEGPLPIGA